MRGFSIVEGVLSIALIGAGFIGLFYVFPTVVHSSLIADQSVVASNLALETLETIFAQRDCNEAGCGYSATLTSIASGAYDSSSVTGFPIYAIDITVLEVDSDIDGGGDSFLDPLPDSGYARVTADISWNAGANTLQFTTLITDH